MMEGNRRHVRDGHEPERRQMASLGLPEFETVDECVQRNRKMLRRLEKRGTARSGYSRVRGSASAIDDRGCHRDGDWLASRRFRLGLIPQAHSLFSKHPGPTFFVTLAHPRWEIALGKLKDAKIAAAKQWMYRRLRRLEHPVIIVGSYEASISVELDDSIFWAGHFHFIIAGASEGQLKAALKIEKKYRKRKYARPLAVDPIGNLAKRLGYSTKRIGKRGVAYIGKNGRQQRRKLPLSGQEQIEFDRWLLGIPAGSRTFLFGCRQHHGKLRKTGA